MRAIPLLFALTLEVFAGDLGVPPRPDVAEYPAHQNAGPAIIAAAIVPASQIEKMFAAGIARHYVVLEVAVYPQNSQAFNVDPFDFRLKTGDAVAYVEKPRDVAAPWPEKRPAGDKPVTVVAESGVAYGRTNDPVNGRRSGWSTYEGVGVTNDPRAAAPPPPPGSDPQLVEQRVAEKVLPDGNTSTAVAGYLFFPKYSRKRPKGSVMELQWSKGNASVSLRLPEK